MRNTFLRGTFILPLLLFMASCSKIDWNNVWHDGNKSKSCDVESFLVDLDTPLPFPYLFTKQYDPSGKYIKEINASFNIIASLEDLPHYRLRLEYRPSKIYFIRMESPYDTVVTAWLNQQGRVIRTSSQNGTWESKFVYRNNRLFSIQWPEAYGITDTCEYDAYGNILSIAHYVDYYFVDREGYFYEYDYSKQGKQQFYLEEIRFINNDFTLMQYMGFFPELNPRHLRTRTLIGQKSFAFGQYLANHVLDAKGKLLQYDIVTPPGQPQVTITQAHLTWNCK